MMNLQWTYPQMLWLLPCLLALLLVGQLRARSGMTRVGRLSLLTARLTWVALCVIAMTLPVWMVEDNHDAPPRVLVMTDISASVATDQARAMEFETALRSGLDGRVEVASMVFAGQAGMKGSEVSPDASQTDIEGALSVADGKSLAWPNASVVLISDGRATRGNAVSAARRLALRGVNVHVMPIGRQIENAPRIERVEPTIGARVGMPAGCRVTLAGGTGQQAHVQLVRETGEVVDQRAVTLGSQKTMMLRFTPKGGGMEMYSVRIVSKEAKSLARMVAPVWVESPPRILVADPFPEEIQAFRSAIAPLNVPVDVIQPGQWPTDLTPYAAVVLSDWTGDELSAEQRRNLQTHVEKKACGLVFIGGGNVVTSRWKTHDFAALLPVTIKDLVSEAASKKKDVSVMFVLDRSGSMSGGLASASGQSISKLDLVKAAVQATVASLPINAQAGVVVFDTGAQVVVPLTPVTQLQDIATKVDAIPGGGGTVIKPGVEMGLQSLAAAKGDKYLIVLTDGVGENSEAASAYWQQVTDAAKKARVSWTSIAVGADADQALLSNLATAARGKFFYCATADQVPMVFAEQAQTIKRLSEKQDRPFRARPGPSVAALESLQDSYFPSLAGRVRVNAKPQTEVVLLSETEDPLLSYWRFGQGRVWAFMGDAKGNWGKDWITWSGYSAFWQQIVQNVMHTPESLHVSVRSFNQGDTASWVFHVTTAEGRPVDGLTTGGEMASVGGGASAGDPPKVEWKRLSPTAFQASFRIPEGEATHLLTLSLDPSQGRGVKYCAMVSSRQNVEMIETGVDHETLGAIAEAGEGLYTTDVGLIAAACQADREQGGMHPVAIAPWLLMLALLIWPIDIAIRKWM